MTHFWIHSESNYFGYEFYILDFHCAGEVLQQERLKAAKAQNPRWLQKLPPDSSCKPPGNASVPHLGGNSDQNQDILKDEHKKDPVRKAGPVLKVESVV